jgi:hypothetical protein
VLLHDGPLFAACQFRAYRDRARRQLAEPVEDVQRPASSEQSSTRFDLLFFPLAVELAQTLKRLSAPGLT